MLVAPSATRDLGRAPFFSAGEKNCDGKRKTFFLHIVSSLRQAGKTFFANGRRRNEFFRPILLFAVVDINKLAPFAIRRRVLLSFRHFLLFAESRKQIYGSFRYWPELCIGEHVLLVFA